MIKIKASLKIFFVILILVIVGVIFAIGRIQSPETKQFAENLPQINENLEILLNNINTDFYNYDLNYNVNRLMNLLTVTDSIINDMEKVELAIKEEMLDVEETITNYQATKQSVNINSLSEEEKNIISQTDISLNDYNSNNDNLNS
ncbi:hypothetical protein J4462_02440 [Candidatus Pacearchaeota archaeon]|nr:hypothetical protein [Candidatus Pacearchaeota archaeon]